MIAGREMAGGRIHGVERQRKRAGGSAGEKTSSGAAEAVLRLQQAAGNQAVSQLARQSAAPPKTLATMTVESDDVGAFSLPIRSKLVRPDLSWTISAPPAGGDVELKLRKVEKEQIVLDKVEVVEGEGQAYMTQVTVRNFQSDANGILFDLVYAGPV